MGQNSVSGLFDGGFFDEGSLFDGRFLGDGAFDVDDFEGGGIEVAFVGDGAATVLALDAFSEFLFKEGDGSWEGLISFFFASILASFFFLASRHIFSCATASS